jgi:hypothetical protein
VDGIEVDAHAPTIEVRDGRQAAVYRATLPEGLPADATFTAAGADPHGNRIP